MSPDSIITLAVVILLLPLLSFTILIFWGKRLGKVSSYIGSAILGIDLLLAILVAYSKVAVHSAENVFSFRFTWFDLGSLSVFGKELAVRADVGVAIDNLAALMLIVVTLISFLVHLFSIEYMHGDKKFSRYFAYLGLFSFSMLGIVIANNFFFMYIFWELVGISSYLLIGFWYEKDSAANAGKKAFITNRIGDLGFFLGILMLYFTFGSFMFEDVFGGLKEGTIPFDSGAMLTLAGIFIFCGAIGKSAQFPLHVWLPDAMEGPTPVSALIHAATMVAAGVYLVARVFPIFSADALTFIAYIGAITAFMAATIAITQTDFKKVLAYSTVSQLGYMILALGVGSYTNGFFHLVTHAWFKAALFLASGSVIHAMHYSMHKAHNHSMDAQDIRNMGGLRHTMPVTYITFLFVTLAISGVPLTSGFLSKDGILAGTLAFASLSGGGIHWLLPIAGFGAAGITAFYMFRLTILAFHGKPKTDIAKKTHENNWLIKLPLVVLAVLSLWIWYSPNPIDASVGWFHKSLPQPETAVPNYQWDFLVMNDHATDVGHDAHGGAVEEHGGHHYINGFEEAIHHFHYPAMILSLLIAGGGILFAFLMYQFRIFNADNWEKMVKPLHTFSLRKWYFDEIYQAGPINGTVGLGKVMALFDTWVIDGLVNLSAAIQRWVSYFIGYFDLYVIDGIVNLVANVTGFIGSILRKVQTGHVQSYVAFVIVGLLVLLYFVV